MIEISFGKLLLLAVIALIVLGPERLPHAARTAGALLRRMRNGWDSVRSEVEREIQAEEIKRSLREAADAARAPHDQMRSDILQARDQVRDTFTDTQVMRARPRDPEAPTPAAADATVVPEVTAEAGKVDPATVVTETPHVRS